MPIKHLLLLIAPMILSAAPDFSQAFKAPKTYPTEAMQFAFEVAEGVRPILYEGENYQGKPTKVFAWYGVPQTGKAPYPAIVLVHGGGGTAFAEWVRRWNERGFAAIAMDLNGSIPIEDFENPQPPHRHFPEGAVVNNLNPQDPIEEQWAFYSISAIIRAHSLLLSFPEIDKKHIGITGISWGGWLTSLTVGYDHRFCYAASVYGCGYLNEGGLTRTVKPLAKLSPELQQKWFDTWNPAACLAKAKMPTFMVNDCDDAAYPLSSWIKTYHEAKPIAAFISQTFGHNHNEGDRPEVLRFAKAKCGLATMPPTFSNFKIVGNEISVDFTGGKPPYSAEAIYTTQQYRGEKRAWIAVQAKIDGNHISATLPKGVIFAFINLTDAEGTVSALE